MSIVRNFNLYLNAGNGSAPYINVNQYDQGEQWVFTLYKEDGTKYSPSTGAIVGIKADNRGIINTGTVDADGRVVINETQQMTAAAGIAIFELLIDGDSHGTANFLVNVEQRPGDNADLSDSDLSLIQQAVDSAEVIVEVIGDSDPSEVIGEHVDDWLDNHPEATTTVQDGAITAPKINNSLWDKILVNEEVSGNPASFDDGVDDVPVSSLKVNLEPVQLGSGDPSPSNIRSIYPANGKNLWEYSAEEFTRYKTYAVSLPAGTYTVSAVVTSSDADSTTCRIGFFNADDTSISAVQIGRNSRKSVTVTLDQECASIYLYASDTANHGAGDTATWADMMIELGSSASAYQPYQGIAIQQTGKNLLNSAFCANRTDKGITTALNVDGSITLTGTAEGSSRYWSASDTLALTLPIGTYTLSPSNLRLEKAGGGNSFGTFSLAEPTTYQNVYFALTNGTTYNTTVYPQLEVGTEATTYEPYTSTSYPYTLGQTVYGGTVDLATGVLTVTDGYIASYNGETLPSTWISDRDVYASGTTPTTGAQVVYKLATPQTINLTPTQVKTLLGYNNISSSGTVDVIYHADTKLYVDRMTAVDNAIIAPTEKDFVATQNYTTGDLVIVNDTLYKVTANIANGGTITPNSNVTQTTLSALIKALS